MPEGGPGFTVSVDRDRCIGSGMCIVYAAGTFDHDETAKAIVREDITDDLDTVRTAVEACPTRALSVVVDQENV